MPSNFVEAVPDDKMDGKDIEVFAASEEDVRRASQIIKVCDVSHARTHTQSCVSRVTLYYCIILSLLQEKVEQNKPIKTTQKSVPEKKRNLINKGKGLANKVKKK